MSELVWYAAYGSNLSRDRFTVYLTGGPIPASPTGRHQVGARDTTPPQDWQRVEFPGRLYFAEQSRHWGRGGVAFVDLNPGAGSSVLARAWLVTIGQLADVYRQENGLAVPGAGDTGDASNRSGTSADGIDEQVRAAAGGAPPVASQPGWYRQLAWCGTLDKLPVVTFTSPHRREPPRPPSSAYRSTIASGLAETWRLDTAAIEAYLTAAGAPTSVEP